MKQIQISKATADKLEEIKTAIADLGDTINQVPLSDNDLYGSMDKTNNHPVKFATQEDMVKMTGDLYKNIDYLHKALADLHDRQTKTKWDLHDKIHACMADHVKNNFHLPAITSAEQMGKVISNLGLDKEFKVHPRNIYASDGSIEKLVLEWEPKK